MHAKSPPPGTWNPVTVSGCCAAVMLSLSGCGNSLAKVSGTVTLDGAPIRGDDDVRATVCFNPIDSGAAAAVGLLDEQGQYTLATGSQHGIAPGEYNVTVSATRLIAANEPGGTPSGQRISPLRYNSPGTSGLKFTIEPGTNTIDLTLTSDSP